MKSYNPVALFVLMVGGFAGCTADVESEEEVSDESEIAPNGANQEASAIELDPATFEPSGDENDSSMRPVEMQFNEEWLLEGGTQGSILSPPPSAVVTALSGSFSDGASILGEHYTTEVGGDCPSGFVRQEKYLWKSGGTAGASCGDAGWSSGSSTNCRFKVNVDIGAWGNVACSWNVDVIPLNQGGVFNYQASATQNALQFTTDYPVSLKAGEKIIAGTCDVPGASGSGDTYLRLVGPSGQTVALNDDIGGPCGYKSKLAYTVPLVNGAGTYTIRAGCYAATSCGGTVSWYLE